MHCGLYTSSQPWAWKTERIDAFLCLSISSIENLAFFDKLSSELNLRFNVRMSSVVLSNAAVFLSRDWLVIENWVLNISAPKLSLRF